MKHPFWITLLEEWCTKRGRSGLTLPFLVGATAIHNGSTLDPTFARDIIDCIIANDEKDTYFRIARCPQVKVPVIGIHHYPPESGYHLHLDDTWGRSEEAKLQEYVADAQRLIARGYFSRVPNGHGYRWSEFTALDIKFIEGVPKNN